MKILPEYTQRENLTEFITFLVTHMTDFEHMRFYGRMIDGKPFKQLYYELGQLSERLNIDAKHIINILLLLQLASLASTGLRLPHGIQQEKLWLLENDLVGMAEDIKRNKVTYISKKLKRASKDFLEYDAVMGECVRQMLGLKMTVNDILGVVMMYQLIKRAHYGMFRGERKPNGEPKIYLDHPVMVLYNRIQRYKDILKAWDSATLRMLFIGDLGHDVREDTYTDARFIERFFDRGSEINILLDALNKHHQHASDDSGFLTDKDIKYLSNIATRSVGIGRIRSAVFSKMGDLHHNYQTLHGFNIEKQAKKANEMRTIILPILIEASVEDVKIKKMFLEFLAHDIGKYFEHFKDIHWRLLWIQRNYEHYHQKDAIFDQAVYLNLIKETSEELAQLLDKYLTGHWDKDQKAQFDQLKRVITEYLGDHAQGSLEKYFKGIEKYLRLSNEFELLQKKITSLQTQLRIAEFPLATKIKAVAAYREGESTVEPMVLMESPIHRRFKDHPVWSPIVRIPIVKNLLVVDIMKYVKHSEQYKKALINAVLPRLAAMAVGENEIRERKGVKGVMTIEFEIRMNGPIYKVPVIRGNRQISVALLEYLKNHFMKKSVVEKTVDFMTFSMLSPGKIFIRPSLIERESHRLFSSQVIAIVFILISVVVQGSNVLNIFTAWWLRQFLLALGTGITAGALTAWVYYFLIHPMDILYQRKSVNERVEHLRKYYAGVVFGFISAIFSLVSRWFIGHYPHELTFHQHEGTLILAVFLISIFYLVDYRSTLKENISSIISITQMILGSVLIFLNVERIETLLTFVTLRTFLSWIITVPVSLGIFMFIFKPVKALTQTITEMSITRERRNDRKENLLTQMKKTNPNEYKRYVTFIAFLGTSIPLTWIMFALLQTFPIFQIKPNEYMKYALVVFMVVIFIGLLQYVMAFWKMNIYDNPHNYRKMRNPHLIYNPLTIVQGVLGGLLVMLVHLVFVRYIQNILFHWHINGQKVKQLLSVIQTNAPNIYAIFGRTSGAVKQPDPEILSYLIFFTAAFMVFQAVHTIISQYDLSASLRFIHQKATAKKLWRRVLFYFSVWGAIRLYTIVMTTFTNVKIYKTTYDYFLYGVLPDLFFSAGIMLLGYVLYARARVFIAEHIQRFSPWKAAYMSSSVMILLSVSLFAALFLIEGPGSFESQFDWNDIAAFMLGILLIWSDLLFNQIRITARALKKVKYVFDRLAEEKISILQILKNVKQVIQTEMLRDMLQNHFKAISQGDLKNRLRTDRKMYLIRQLVRLGGVNRLEAASLTEAKIAKAMWDADEVIKELSHEPFVEDGSVEVHYLVYITDHLKRIFKHHLGFNGLPAFNVSVSRLYSALNIRIPEPMRYFNTKMREALLYLAEHQRHIQQIRIYLSAVWGYHKDDTTIEEIVHMIAGENANIEKLNRIRSIVGNRLIQEGKTVHERISHEEIVEMLQQMVAVIQEVVPRIEQIEMVLSNTDAGGKVEDTLSIGKAILRARIPGTRYAAHLHDKGEGLVHAAALLSLGFYYFDTSIGNRGGRITEQNKSVEGNIPSTDFIFMFQEIFGIKMNRSFEGYRTLDRIFERELEDDFTAHTVSMGLHRLNWLSLTAVTQYALFRKNQKLHADRLKEADDIAATLRSSSIIN
ncbi:MAG: hypothetical protein KC713_04735, partial [Candidatus Omnitrophica bacterium]|nr:hypothetical protein [Candidatus Omnitrophota bacterium]